MREVVTIRIGDSDLIGSCTLPPLPSKRALGFLFTNPGHVPRDGHAGLTAIACDRLAARGFACFRFDLPGLGDTKGTLPERAETLYDFVANGGYAPTASELAKALCDRWDLEGVVMGGLCGAAVTGIYAADRDPKRVRGLILIEPEVFKTLPHAAPSATKDVPSVSAPRVVKKMTDKAFSYWGWMTLLTEENAYAKYIPLPRKAILAKLMKGCELPSVANVSLVEAWQRVRIRCTPTLVATAKGKVRELFFDRVNSVALDRIGTTGMEHHRIDNTNHIFTTGGAIERMIYLLEDWSDRVLTRQRAG